MNSLSKSQDHSTRPSEAMTHALELLEQADGLVIAAGAGMGVDSGLPDFRGNQGFWKAYPALGRAGMNFYEVASPDTFHRDPRLAWGFYGHRLQLYRETWPHEGFGILQSWAARMPNGVFVFTSNVDGQFQKAGFDDERIAEVHGSIHHLQCLSPCRQNIWPADALVPDIDASECRWRGDLPACPHCGGLARPNILMFGDDGWVADRQAEQLKRLQAWLSGVRRPLVVEIGAGTAVPTVRHFSHQVIQAWGGRLLRLNPDEATVPSAMDVGLPMGGLQAIRALDTGVRSRGDQGPGPQ
jgi:NAD-dependent SIR2 family protein deacetylase